MLLHRSASDPVGKIARYLSQQESLQAPVLIAWSRNFESWISEARAKEPERFARDLLPSLSAIDPKLAAFYLGTFEREIA
jgi:hypothetical protein